MPPFSKYATASNLFSISWEAFLLEAKAYFPTTSIAGGFFMLKRTIKKREPGVHVFSISRANFFNLNTKAQ